MDLIALEREMDRLDGGARRRALEGAAAALKAGRLETVRASGAVNVHLHTFFSFNACGWSPSRIAWEARKTGLEVAGTVDFDVLDAMEEFFGAGDLLEIRTVAALETRVFVPEYADREINSPGEPGVSYFMGAGFTTLPHHASPAGLRLSALRHQARQRNEAMLERLASCLAPLTVDYASDVLPLTPSGNATERHMLATLDGAARKLFPDRKGLAEFWSRVLGLGAGEMEGILEDPVRFRNLVRSKLMKKGGPGYVQPGRDTFPPLGDVIRRFVEAGAIPCIAWLDGTLAGEADAGRLLDDFMAQGCLALNIIPDRNWNIAKAEEKRLKTGKLREILEAARERDLIISVGTEMNNHGQKFVDTFDAPEMAPWASDFRDGALALYGHTVIQRALGKGRTSAWALRIFGADRKRANRFYLEAGRRAFPPRRALERLSKLQFTADPETILHGLRDLE